MIQIKKRLEIRFFFVQIKSYPQYGIIDSVLERISSDQLFKF